MELFNPTHQDNNHEILSDGLHLVKFKNAKLEALRIFKNLHSAFKSTLALSMMLKENYPLLSSLFDNSKFVNESVERSSKIISVLERNQMKCAFFGRTSNGKSSVINAILGKKILPFGIGHTTNCFVQVQGTAKDRGFITKNQAGDEVEEDIPESNSLPVNSLAELSHAFSQARLSSDAVIRLYWPQRDCALLRAEVSLLDSPGVDVEPNLDFWIERHCQDADVFVLVCNAESTLTNSEKEFFFKVKEKISNPIIFIINNRWDKCDNDSEKQVESTRKQHQSRCVQFLARELEVMTEKEAEDHVFFVSARDVVEQRSTESSNKSAEASSVKIPDKVRERLVSFQKFESALEKNLCQSALQTKFSGHTSQAILLSDQLIKIIKQTEGRIVNSLRDSTKSKLDLIGRLKNTETGSVTVRATCKARLSTTQTTIARCIDDSLSTQIAQLGSIVRAYESPVRFSTESIRLTAYKSALNSFLEVQLSARMTAFCAASIRSEMQQFKLAAIADFGKLLNTEIDKSLCDSVESVNSLDLSIPCNTLLSDFREELQFQWPLRSMLTGILHLSSSHRQLLSIISLPNEVEPTVRQRVSTFRPLFNQISDVLLNRQFLGLCFVTGAVYKSTGLRLVLSTGCSYGLLYVYERYRWTRLTQEANFRRQYVRYASRQLANLADICCNNYACVVKQEMLMNLKSLSRLTDDHLAQLQHDVQKCDSDIGILTECMKNTDGLRFTANDVLKDLVSFKSKYL